MLLFTKNLICTTRLATHFSRCLFSSQASMSHNQRLPSGYNIPTPFSLYLKENSKTGESAVEIAKKVAKTWKELNNAQKEEYRKKALKIGEERRLAFESLSEIKQFQLRESQSLLRQQQILRARRKILHERKEKSGRPKIPPNAFAIFLGEKLKESTVTSNAERKELFSKMAVAWKTLTQLEKEKYENIAKEKKTVYLNDLEKWKKEADLIPSQETKELLSKFKKLQTH